MQSEITRRVAMSVLAGTAAGSLVAAAAESAAPSPESTPLKGNIKHSACKWCYKTLSVDELCQAGAKIGLKAIDLLDENEWSIPAKYGLTCAMATGPSNIKDGWNVPGDHDKLVKESERRLPLIAEAKLPNMIVFSGNRRGLSDSDGIKNCAAGLKRIMPLAEKLGVTVCMELLNSKHDHKDYQCDHTPWGVAVVDAVGSPRFKLLYDIYHMQIMEGDVVATITQYKDYIAHYHTGGVPGRHEIDDTQELFYPKVCQAIVATGFTGYLAQEFLPTGDPVTSLAKCVRICDV